MPRVSLQPARSRSCAPRKAVQPHVQNIEFLAGADGKPPRRATGKGHGRRRRGQSPAAAAEQDAAATLTLADLFPAGCDREGARLPVAQDSEWEYTQGVLRKAMSDSPEDERLASLFDSMTAALDGWHDYVRLRDESTQLTSGSALSKLDKVRFDDELRRCVDRQRERVTAADSGAVRCIDADDAARVLCRRRRNGDAHVQKISHEIQRWQARVAWADSPSASGQSAVSDGTFSPSSNWLADSTGSAAVCLRERRALSSASPCAPDWFRSAQAGGDCFFMSSLADEIGEVTAGDDRVSDPPASPASVYAGSLPPLQKCVLPSTPQTAASERGPLTTPARFSNQAAERTAIDAEQWPCNETASAAASSRSLGEHTGLVSPACSCPSPRVSATPVPPARPATASVHLTFSRPSSPLPHIDSPFAVTHNNVNADYAPRIRSPAKPKHDSPPGRPARRGAAVPQYAAISASEVSVSLTASADTPLGPGQWDLNTDTRRLLGSGAHGDVFRAKLRTLEDGGEQVRDVAVKRVKVTDRRTRALILRELEVWKRVGDGTDAASRHVVRYHCHGYDRRERTYSIVMEMCTFGSVQDVVNMVWANAGHWPWRNDGLLERDALLDAYRANASCTTSETGTMLQRRDSVDDTYGPSSADGASSQNTRSRPGSARAPGFVRRLPEATTSRLLAHTLRGLAYIHSCKVIHRDIKPSNILLGDDGVARLCDFGVSVQMRSGSSMRRTLVGTLGFLAPEVIQENPYTTAADMWSLGCTAMEVVSGQRPYQNLPPAAAMFRTVQDLEPPLPDPRKPGGVLSEVALDFLRRCLRKDPRERPTAAAAAEHSFVHPSAEPLITDGSLSDRVDG